MKKNLVAMLLAVGVIATATGCGSTESTSTTSTTEYVTEEATTEVAQVEETTEYVEAETEEVVEAAEEITVEDLTVKVREAMEAAPYVVTDYTVIVDTLGTDGNYNSYYNKESNTVYNDCDINGTYWTDVNSNTLFMLDTANNYSIVNSEEYTDYTVSRALNIPAIYKSSEESSAACTLDSIIDNTVTVTIDNTTDNGNNTTTVVTINTETGLINSKYYTETNESGEAVSEVKLNLSYPTEGTPEYDEFIQKTTIPAEAIEAANNQ